jgi:hypothetical protein
MAESSARAETAPARREQMTKWVTGELEGLIWSSVTFFPQGDLRRNLDV